MRDIQSISISSDSDIGTARRRINLFAANIGFTSEELAELDIAVQELATNAVRYAKSGGTLHFSSLNSNLNCRAETSPTNESKPQLITPSLAAVAGDGIELVYWDKGPGIDDTARALRDGVSTGGSLGAGLGAIRRLTDEFDIYSLVNHKPNDLASTTATTNANQLVNASLLRARSIYGTTILCRKRPATHKVMLSNNTPSNRHSQPDGSPSNNFINRYTLAPPSLSSSPQTSASSTMRDLTATNARHHHHHHHHQQQPALTSCGAWSRPFPGETANGDAYFVKSGEDTTLAAVVDGLGHGSGAQIAADAALQCLRNWDGEPLDELMLITHEALRPTRGAVMSVVVIDHAHKRFSFAGVGNIQTRVFNAPEPIHPVTINGTLGARLARVPVWTHAWRDGAIIIMNSDGISATWDAAQYPQLFEHDPQTIAAVLMRDYARETDDATVLVIK